MIPRPLAARLSSTDAGAAAASHQPAELLLHLMAHYFITADCHIVALAPMPSSHWRSPHHCCHRIMIVSLLATLNVVVVIIVIATANSPSPPPQDLCLIVVCMTNSPLPTPASPSNTIRGSGVLGGLCRWWSILGRQRES